MPMTSAAPTQARWLHEQPGQTETVEQLIRRAVAYLTEARMTFSSSKVSRLVRSHIRSGGNVQGAAQAVEAYFLTHSDPTGETAVRNVMAGTR